MGALGVTTWEKKPMVRVKSCGKAHIWCGKCRPEIRTKISAAQKKRWFATTSLADRRQTPEHRAKIGAAVREAMRDPAIRAKISASLRGRKFSPERRARMSAVARVAMRDPAIRAKISAATREAMRDPAIRAKISATSKGRKASPETRAKVKRTWAAKVAKLGPWLGDNGHRVNFKGWSIRDGVSGARYFVRMIRGWVIHARAVWVQAHGPIPMGMRIYHADYDTFNDSLDNLLMETPRSWRHARNS